MIELFIEFTDQIFWEGYAEQMAEESPQKFNYELTDFLTLYNY